MTNRFRTLIVFSSVLVTGEVVALVPGWEAEIEFTIPRNKVPDSIRQIAIDHAIAQKDSDDLEPSYFHVTLDLSVETSEQLVESMSDWEVE